MNKVILVGNCGKDPEIGKTNTGDLWARVSLATSYSWKDKDTGDKKEKTEWHRIVIWGDGLIENVVKPYIKKGQKLVVNGKLRTRKWQDQSGKDCYATEVVVQGFDCNIELVRSSKGGHRDEPPMDEADPYGDSQEAPPKSDVAPYDKKIDQEIPF